MILIIILWTIIGLLSFSIPGGSYYLNVLSILAWIATVIYFFFKDSEFSISVLIFFISFTVASMSCFVAEEGNFFSEIKELSFLTGALTRNLILCTIMFLFCYITHATLKRIRLIKTCLSSAVNHFFKSVILMVVVISIIVLLGINIKYGNPNNYNVDRFYYWSNIAPSWGTYFKFILIQMAIFLGLFYSLDKKKSYLVLFIFSLISQVLVGEKLSGLYISVLLFLIPIIVIRKVKITKLLLHPKTIIITLLGLAILFFIILASYNAIGGRENGFQLFLNRLILQSQMWWSVDHISNNQVNLSEAIVHMLGFYSTSNAETGIYYLMSRITSPDTFDWFYEQGITFTMASPVNFLYYFGRVYSLFAVIPIGILLGFTVHILINSIKIRDCLLIFFSLKLFYMMIRVVTMGEVHLIFDYKFLIILIIVVFYIMQAHKKNYLHI